MSEVAVEYMFGMNDTIYGVIKHINGHNLSKDDMAFLLNKYNELNGFEVPKPGQVVNIPLKM